jgi:hypothetical protein
MPLRLNRSRVRASPATKAKPPVAPSTSIRHAPGVQKPRVVDVADSQLETGDAQYRDEIATAASGSDDRYYPRLVILCQFLVLS